jgi:hypothetical protein
MFLNKSISLNSVNRLVLTIETVLCEVGTGFIREFFLIYRDLGYKPVGRGFDS